MNRRAVLAALPLCAVTAHAQAEVDRPPLVAGELLHDLIFVRAQVGSADGRFLLDTGAPVSVLDQAFAARAGIKAVNGELLRGPGGMGQAWRGASANLRVGKAVQAVVAPSITDLAAISARMGLELAGLVGGDLLSNFLVQLDYRTAQVRFGRAGSVASPAGAIAMRVGRTPYVQAAVTAAGVRRLAEFQIDTGANTAVVLNRRFAAQAFPSMANAQGAQIGVGGVTTTRIGRVSALEIASVRMADLQAEFSDDMAADDASREYAGVIGGAAWRGRQITLDYPGRRFWLA